MLKDEKNTACGSCELGAKASFQRFGLNTTGFDFTLALAGNPNTGKTTLFNRLTGLRMHVGNWPGKTVTQAVGAFRFGSHKYRLVDLPGAYSLLSRSADEEVARDFILFGKPDATVIVCDATALERNLNLTLQILEITGRCVIALNLMDEAERRGIDLDVRSLARDLGVRVLPISARSGKGVPELLQAVGEVASEQGDVPPPRSLKLAPEVKKAVEPIEAALRDLHPGLLNARWVALRLLEGDESVIAEIRAGTLGSAQHGIGGLVA